MSVKFALTQSEEEIVEMYARQIQSEMKNGASIETLKACLSGITAPYLLDEAFSRAIKNMNTGGIRI